MTRVPEPDEWASAQAQFEAGRVIGLPMRTRSGTQVTVAVTQDWLRSWSTLPLTHLERTAIRNVCLQLACGWVHPALDTRPLELAPSGAWIGSPAEGYTLTWRAHWIDERMPVLLTLTANGAHPDDGHDQLTEPDLPVV